MVYVDTMFDLFSDGFWVMNNYKLQKICSVSQVGQDGGPSSLRQEFEPPTEYQAGVGYL